MRRNPRLIWFLALCAAFFCQNAFGASLTWKQQGEGEVFIFRFKATLPPGEPMQRGLTEIELPLPRNFWKKERKPKKTDFSASSFVRGVEYTPDAIIILARGDAFEFSSSVRPKTRELLLEFRPYVKAPPPLQNDTAPPAPSHPSGDAEPESFSGLGSLRGKVSRAGQMPVRNGTDPEAVGAPSSVPSSPAPPAAANESVQTAALPDTGAAPAMVSHTDLPADEPAAATPAAKRISSTPQAGQFAIEPVAVLPSLDHARTLRDGTGDGTESNGTPAAPGTGGVSESPAWSAPPEPTQTASGPGDDDRSPDNASAPRAESEGAATEMAVEQPEIVPPAANDSDMANGSGAEAHVANVSDANATAELEALFAEAQKAFSRGKLEDGKAAVEAMLRHPGASEALREDLLYTLADVAMQQGRDDLNGNFLTILQAYETAKNANIHSRNMPEALTNMGYLHLAVGNVPEAKGYFDLLRRRYPDDTRVPMTDYYWGEHYLKRGEYSKAAEHLQYVVRNHPYSSAAASSTLGLLKAFMELGFFDKAMELVHAVEKRWPHYYLSDPSFLMTAGHAAMATGQPGPARDYFWAYVNIVPQAPDADVAMARIGDILMQEGKQNAAREIYHRAAQAYPDREGGLIAQMRLAEEGVLDQPSVGDMTPVFGRSGMNPEDVYTRILKKKDSHLAPVARLKLAMWRLWEKKYAEAMEEADVFQRTYPDHDLLPKAREVADRALQDWIANDLAQENFEAVLKVWSDHAAIFEGRELPPGIRLALAMARSRTGQSREALEMVWPFVFSLPKGEYSEAGMDLLLSTLLELQQWDDIPQLADRVKAWALDADRQRQVDYAAALAQENLLRPDRARPLWEKLGTDMNLSDAQRGYALYFLARAALDAGKLERSTVLAQDALNLFLKEKNDIPKIKDCLELLALAADRGGRLRDALAWSLEADEYVPEGDRDWPAHTYRKALRFRKNGNMEKWRENLEAIIRVVPESLYSRMARAELESARLEREVEKFR